MGELRLAERELDGLFFDPCMRLYLPLSELDGNSFMSRDQYGHLCTVTGAAWGIEGRTFNGSSDLISIPDSPVLTFNGTTDQPFSIETLVFPTVATSSGHIIAKGTGALNGEYMIFLDTTLGRIYWRLLDDGAARLSVYTGNLVSTLNTWYHILCTYDGSMSIAGLRVYLNGIERTTTNNSSGTYGGMKDTTYVVELGRKASGNYFPGIIKLIAVTGKVFNPVEALEHYLAIEERFG